MARTRMIEVLTGRGQILDGPVEPFSVRRTADCTTKSFARPLRTARHIGRGEDW